ncbi:MAG: hypothetical protein GF364_03440 [Candidatus Lokiarchaeota archaeon]|nr:hypothetical protein [Candidatus Lokiarchaeota archaeon]
MILTSSDEMILKAVCWIIVIVECFVVAIVLYKYLKEKSESEYSKKISIGYVFFAVGYAICRIFFLISDFEQIENDTSRFYVIVVILGYISVISAILWLAHTIEFYLMQSRRKITTKLLIIMLSIVVVMFIFATIYYDSELTMNIARYSVYIISGIAGFIVFFFYLSLVFKTVGAVRTRFFVNFIGICLIFAGMVFDSEYLQYLLPVWLPPLFAGVGFIMFSLAQIKK